MDTCTRTLAGILTKGRIGLALRGALLTLLLILAACGGASTGTQVLAATPPSPPSGPTAPAEPPPPLPMPTMPTAYLVLPEPSAGRMAPAVVTAHIDLGRQSYDLAELDWLPTGDGEFYATGPVTDSGGGILDVTEAIEHFADLDLSIGHEWHRSSQGEGEYYVTGPGGTRSHVTDRIKIRPDSILKVGGVDIGGAVGYAGSLEGTSFGYGDNDDLGFETLYLRLEDGANPRSKGRDYVTLSSWWRWTRGHIGSLGDYQFGVGDEHGLGKQTIYLPFDPTGTNRTYRMTWHVSHTGTEDGKDWHRTRIDWSVNGGTWVAPSHHRTTDPRTGEVVDLSAPGAIRGYAAQWLLGPGTWDVRCRITNTDGEETILTESVRVDPDTRTQVLVDSNGQGDFDTLAAAVEAHGFQDDMRYVLADGHTERLFEPVRIEANNAYIVAQPGDRKPKLQANISDYWLWCVKTYSGFVVDGLELVPRGDEAGSGVLCSGSFWSVVNCDFGGAFGAGSDRFASLVVPGGRRTIWKALTVSSRTTRARKPRTTASS